MFNFALFGLSLFVTVGVTGIFLAIKFPERPGLTFIQKLEQKKFQRSFLMFAIGFGGLLALLLRAFDASEILVVTVISISMTEYMLLRGVQS